MKNLFYRFYKNILYSIVLSLIFVNMAYGQTVKSSGPEEQQAGPVMTAAMAAAYRGDSASLRSFLEKGENVNAAGPGGTTLLMFAAMSPSDNAETVSLLLKYGARYDKTDVNGTSALEIAKNRGKIESAAVLESFYRADFVNTMLLIAYLLVVLITIRFEKDGEDEKEPLSDTNRMKEYYTGETFEKISGGLKNVKEKFQH